MFRIHALLAILFALATAGCGYYGADGTYHVPFEGLTAACLKVQNDPRSSVELARVEYLDPFTADVRYTEAVSLRPGADGEIMDMAIPAGDYFVVGVFADGYEDRPAALAGYPVTTLTEEDADAQGLPEASVAFLHP